MVTVIKPCEPDEPIDQPVLVVMVITPEPEPFVLITTNSKLLPTLALDTTASKSVAKGSVYAAAVVVGVPKIIPFSN